MIQIEFYTNAHKGQRQALFGLAARAGRVDPSDAAALKALEQDLQAIRQLIKEHIENEEKYIHPLLADRVPGGALELEEDHRNHKRRLDELIANVNGILGKPAEFEKKRKMLLEFYRAFNRFVAHYIEHINKEEEHVMPTLWDLCTEDELRNTLRNLISGPPDMMLRNLTMMFPAMNFAELTELYAVAKASMPPEGINMLRGIAEKTLSPTDWAILKERFDRIP